MLTEFNGESWQEVKKVLRKEYEEQDVDQQMNTREFLEALIRKPRTKGDLKAYCIQFYAISARLYKRKRLDQHTRVRWFLQGLPRETIIKVVSIPILRQVSIPILMHLHQLEAYFGVFNLGPVE